MISYRIMARGIAMKDNRTDSPKNCTINWRRLAPITLRSPISLARCMERTVDRLIKLILTTNRSKTPMENMMYTLVGLLLPIKEVMCRDFSRKSRNG